MAMIPVTYLSGATLSNTLGMFKRGTIAQNLKTLLESGYKWWSGIDIQSNQYLIYSDTYTMGTTTQANATPVAWSTPDLTDTSLLNLINTLPPRVGKTPFTSLPIALQWLQSSNQFFLIRTGTENIIKSGLQLYVDAGRYNSYSGTGTNWVDLSGEGNNGTLINQTSYTTTGVGSMSFDGTDDYVNFGNPVDLQITNNLTIDVWLRANSAGNYTTAVAKSNGATGGFTVQLRGLVNEWRFWVNFGVNTLGNGSNNGWYYANFPKTWNDSKWHHFVGIWNGNTKTVDIYIDGILGTTNAGGNPSGESGSIGNYNGNLVVGSETGGNNPLNGDVSSLKVYNISLTPEQVLQNFNAQKYRFGYYDIVQSGLTINLDTTNYLSYPRSGNTWTNLLGNNINATLENSPTFSGGTIPSISFDGSDEWAVFPSTSAWGNNPFTLISWCYPKFDQYSYGAPMLTKAPDCSGGIEWALEYGRDSNKFSIYGGGPIKYTTNTYPKNNWYHATSVYDGTNLSFYINGQLDSTHTGYYPGGGNGRIAVGTYYGCGPVNEWFGNISEAQVYTRALSGQEVLQNYESKRLLYGTTGVTTSGLTLNLDAANYASYGGVGTVWKDISGNAYDGILTNGPIYSNSGVSSSIVVDGIDDFIAGNTLTNLMNGSTTLTLIIWIYPTNLNNTDAGGSGYKTLVDTPGRHLSLWLGTQGKGQYYSIGGTTGSYNTNFNWENNKWQMVTIIANSSDGQIIKNNYDVSQTVGKGNTFTQQITFGNNTSTGGSSLEGRYGSIQLYNRALSVAEVSQNYNAQKSRFGL